MKGMKKYQKLQFKKKLQKSLEQAKKGKVRTLSSEELDRWEKELEDDSQLTK